jgi:hypothetical protein
MGQGDEDGLYHFACRAMQTKSTVQRINAAAGPIALDARSGREKRGVWLRFVLKRPPRNSQGQLET